MREQQLAWVPVLLRTSEPAGAGGDTSGTPKDTGVEAEFPWAPKRTQGHSEAGTASLRIQLHAQPGRRHR